MLSMSINGKLVSVSLLLVPQKLMSCILLVGNLYYLDFVENNITDKKVSLISLYSFKVRNSIIYNVTYSKSMSAKLLKFKRSTVLFFNY